METRKLKWYYDKPKFEDIKGKLLICEKRGNCGSWFNAWNDDDELWDYETMFDESFVRYAIIDVSEEPFPLDGVIPELEKWTSDGYRAHYFKEQEISIYVYGETKEQATSNWNKFVRRIK